MAQHPKKPAVDGATDDTEAVQAAVDAAAEAETNEHPTPTQEELNEHKRRLAETGNYYSTRESKAD